MAPLKPIIVTGAVILLLAAASAQKQFVPFTYTGAKGPENWGSLTTDYAECSDGKSQSPININTKDVVHDSALPLLRKYTGTKGTLMNNGYNIAVAYGDGAGFAKIDGKMYTFIQMHWHTPSEHTVNGKRFAAETHMVHIAKDGTVGVVGALYEYGEADPFIHQIKDSLSELTMRTNSGEQGVKIPVSVDTKDLIRKNSQFLVYNGSNSLPPCQEIIAYHILVKRRTISKEQVKAFKAPLNSSFMNNFRPLQALNGRKVQLYHSEHWN